MTPNRMTTRGVQKGVSCLCDHARRSLVRPRCALSVPASFVIASRFLLRSILPFLEPSFDALNCTQPPLHLTCLVPLVSQAPKPLHPFTTSNRVSSNSRSMRMKAIVLTRPSFRLRHLHRTPFQHHNLPNAFSDNTASDARADCIDP